MREHIANSPLAANRQVNEHLSTYLRGLQNSKLFMQVLSEAVARAWAGKRSINWALREMARASGATRGIPLETIPHRGGNLFSNQEFFSWAFRRAYFIDLVLIGAGGHTANAHLVQDLVADRAFRAAGQTMTGPEFRALLGQAQGTVTPSATNQAIPEAERGRPVNVGQLIWYLVNDTFVDYLPRPEVLGRLTRETGMH